VNDCTCEADFNADQTEGCAPMTVTFSDDSENATSWSWNFPGGSPSSATGAAPHSVTYNNPGSYDVTLDINCPYGDDSETKTDYIRVNDCTCEADFTSNATSGCAPLKVRFDDNSVNATSWIWSFPGGSPSSATGQGPHYIMYNNPGKYSVELEVNCPHSSDTIVRNDYIQVNDCTCEADFEGDSTTGCVPLEVTFTDKSENATDWRWTFMGGSPASATGAGPHVITYNDTGTFDVSLDIDCHDGSDSKTRSNYIQTHDCACKADFKTDTTTGPVPLKVTFTDQSQNATSWNWSFPGGEPSSVQGQGPHTVTYNDSGSFDVSLKISCPFNSDKVLKSSLILPLLPPLELYYDYGDAPEGAIAYPSTGTIGNFPTCKNVGPAGYIRHSYSISPRYHRAIISLGDSIDYEIDGNEGACFGFASIKYDRDEPSCSERFPLVVGCNDQGLFVPDIYTISENAGVEVVTLVCDYMFGKPLGEPCQTVEWGRDIDIIYNCLMDQGAFFNVLIDWNQDGEWGGASECSDSPDRTANEHVLENFHVPFGGFRRTLGWEDPPGFVIGPDTGYVWMRVTITPGQIPLPWDGSGDFSAGETEDYLIRISPMDELYDYGDAPEGAIAYPTGVIGRFPTCVNSDLSGYIRHRGDKTTYFGKWVDYENEGNGGRCPDFSMFYNMDNRICIHSDNGFNRFREYTIHTVTNWIGPYCEIDIDTRYEDYIFGVACYKLLWKGPKNDLDLSYHTDNLSGAYVNILADWNQDGEWSGSSECTECFEGTAYEHVLQNFHVPCNPLGGRIDDYNPPAFFVGPNSGYVWIRVTITNDPIPIPWDGSGDFNTGETEDYMVKVAPLNRLHDYGDAPFGRSFVGPGDRHEYAHRINPDVYLGFCIDGDKWAVGDIEARGDDKDTIDDEDGVIFEPTQRIGSAFGVAITTSVDGYLKGWIDFNRDDDWFDPEDLVLDTRTIAGENHFEITIPASVDTGLTYCRFRFSTESIPNVFLRMPDGEVEDYAIYFEHATETKCDFGDAPLPYKTILADSGAFHVINPDIYLGKGVDADENGQPDKEALGDDNDGNDDEDGVTFPDSLFIGDSTFVQVVASVPGYLKAWIDFNQDGDWDDENETIIASQAAGGNNEFEIIIPKEAKPGSTFARFRFSSSDSFSKYFGEMVDGEIEDYMILLFEFPEFLIPYDYGDAPDGVLAYPKQWVEHSDVDIIGHFPTCGPEHYIRHSMCPEDERTSFLRVDYETGGNAGDCSFSLYDQDELGSDYYFCFYDESWMDASLDRTLISQIKFQEGDTRMSDVPYIKYVGYGSSGEVNHLYTCQVGRWGTQYRFPEISDGNLDIDIHFEKTAYVNVLVDWNQDGKWCGSSDMLFCEDESPPHLHEHILQDFFIVKTTDSPRGWRLSFYEPPNFRIGPNPGYVWARFTVTSTPISIENWDGSGFFPDGETEDYLLYVTDPANPQYRDYGDAPDGNLAYPSHGIIGDFPTCGSDPTEFIRHGNEEGNFKMYFGFFRKPTIERSGNHGFCGISWNLDDDDGIRTDDGMRYCPTSYTIEGPPGSETVISEFPGACGWPHLSHSRASIGRPRQLTYFGKGLNIAWVVNPDLGTDAYINILVDWNQDGKWADSVNCGEGLGYTDEHLVKNFRTNETSRDGFRVLVERPDDFRIGPNVGYIWARFTISETPVPLPWNGSGDFSDGETEDYLLLIQEDSLDFGDVPWNALEIRRGAVHRIVSGFYLGNTVDADYDGFPNENALGDDNHGVDDEDGVEFLDTLVPGTESKISVTASADGFLNAWIDFDVDSLWSFENHIFIDEPLVAGENFLKFRTPEEAETGVTYARFRFSDIRGLTAYIGAYDPILDLLFFPNGEVEDYLVTISEEKSNIEKELDNGIVPKKYELSQNIPNPFNPTTEIHFALPKAEHVNLSIYNLVGQELRNIVNEHKDAGNYVATWDAKDDSGNQLPSGIYIYRMKAGNFVQSKKLIIAK